MKISIITINLNNCEGLEQTITSVIGQDLRPFEYIVIDGGSSDGSTNLIRLYSKEITYSVSEEDAGIYSAMNKGIIKAKGDYCLFLNSGDVLFNRNVISDISKLDPVDDILTGNTFVKSAIYGMQYVEAPENISFNTFFVHTILHQATLIRTALFAKIGLYNENLKIVGDWEFFVKAFFLHQCSYRHINVTISVFDTDGISSRPENFKLSLKERDEVFQKYFPYFIKDYRLLQPNSTYLFLQNIQRNHFLSRIFIILSRIANRIIKLFSR